MAKMHSFEIIKCHGSANDFIMVDTTRDSELQNVDWEAFARVACDRRSGIGSDGLLLVVRNEEGIYGMDMLNPDGTHAEMCGNGIRCVARLAHERGYLKNGVLFSAKKMFRINSEEALAEGIETFSVEIEIELKSPSFGFAKDGKPFISKKIKALDPNLRFTALNLGNPHIVAEVSRVDLDHLKRLGKRVKRLRQEFPDGINLSLYERRSAHELFVATYERGAGITMSCGTAMTASATAAVIPYGGAKGERIDVMNRGGKVFCSTRRVDGKIVTKLAGNATFEWIGESSFDNGNFNYHIKERTRENRAWRNYVKRLNR